MLFRSQDKKKLDLVQNLLQYCLTDGQKDSEALGYIPLPPGVIEKVKAATQNISLAAS